jgi:imidazolonepropionase-like amidohydrolase
MKIHLRLFALLIFQTSSLIAGGNSFILTNARVFDGDSLHLQTNVLVLGGRISDIGPSLANDDVPQIDCKGYTLIPGLIDAHTHTESVEQLRQSLVFGVTTVLDMGTFPEHDKIIRIAAASRKDVADFRSSGIFITAPGGHGTEYGYDIPTLADADQAESFVDERIRKGADYLKLVINGVRHERDGMPILDPETIQAVVKISHSRNKLVMTHVESGNDVRLAVAAGVDGLVHHWRDSGARPDLAKLIASKNICVMPTLTAIDGFLNIGPQQLLSDTLIRPYLSQASLHDLQKDIAVPPGMTMQPHMDGMRSLIDEKVVILTGSDAFSKNPRIVHGASLHRLLELFVEAGLTPEETLRSATSLVADVFSLDDRGRIKPGLRADLVLLKSDPTQNIKATRDIIKIWREGIEVNR